MRGKVCVIRHQHRPDGITPAYAGKRVEKAAVKRGVDGSPPPMRGKAFRKICNNLFNRITPAYAGKRRDIDRRQKCSRDHPRLCGEKFLVNVNSWGGTGITPAYAGKSFYLCLGSFVVQDHPRLCGEKTKKIPKQRYFFHQPASFSFSLQYT